ncbi:MAG: hypothetical protein NE327_10045 [Lentisphaeraceae bacterium]|nr:hypothetical protein [Lentisphaeraceae bacterium]
MSKRTKIFLALFQVFIILNAVALVKNFQHEKERHELMAWANENDVSLSYDYPEKINKIPNFLKGLVKKIIKKELTSIKINEANIESLLENHELIHSELRQLESIHIETEVPQESLKRIQRNWPKCRIILDKDSKT